MAKFVFDQKTKQNKTNKQKQKQKTNKQTNKNKNKQTNIRAEFHRVYFWLIFFSNSLKI